ncbi:MAG: glycosyltransferase family 2 protein [Candidatus Aenigmarchaeota archaeon]|nr:glycosyltransferase family 2 protein [Candidatus Aenigmarchaeota archaeon]
MQFTDLVFYVTSFFSIYFSVFLLLSIFEKTRVKKKKMKKYPFVSVVIPAYNEEDVIEDTVLSVVNQNYPKNRYEIIVVDDGSKDRTREIVRKLIKKIRKPKIRLLVHRKNKGKARSLNDAIRISKGKYFVTVDADSFPREDCLIKGVELLESDKDVVAASAVVKVYKPKTIIQHLQYLEYLAYAFLKKILSKIYAIHVLPGPFTIYRKSELKRVGGFDENTLVEDQEIAYRLQKHNKKILQINDAIVETVAPPTLKKLYRQRRRWAIGSLLTLWKYRDMLFRKEYGDFSLYQLPNLLVAMILPIIIVVMFSFHAYNWLNDLYIKIQVYGTDLSWLFPDSIEQIRESFTLSKFTTDFTMIYLLVTMYLITSFMLYRSFRMVGEKINAKKIIIAIPFFVFYYIIISFIYTFSYVELLLAKIGKRALKW